MAVLRGLVASVLWIGVVIAVTVVVFHRWPVTRKFRAMCAIFFGSVPACAATYWWMPAAWFGPPSVLGLLNGLYLHHFWFFGVFVQLYALADRGFSVAILSDLCHSATPHRTREEIKHAYAGGKGTAVEKFAALQAAGVTIIESPADIGKIVAATKPGQAVIPR